MEPDTEKIARIRFNLAANRMLVAGWRFYLSLKANPYWYLQPRVPAGHPDGGQWLAGALGAAASLLPVLQRVGVVALKRLRDLARSLAPRLRSVPRRWDADRQPSEDTYDKDTRRISANSWQRRGEPNIRFRNEAELRRYLGPAGPGREWHHIVEKRLAGRDGFSPELIHSTDNIISLPLEVHRRVSAKMSSKDHKFGGGEIRRVWMEKLPFGNQYDRGLDLIEETLEELGYDPSRF